MENLFDKSFWVVLHTMSFIYPEDPNIDDKKKNYNFIKSIRDIIPCEVCKRDYTNYINKTIHQPENESENEPENEPETNPDKSIKITYESNVLKNKQNYIKWVIKFHNRVNKKLNKKEYSYEEVKDYYENIIRNSEMLNKNENN